MRWLVVVLILSGCAPSVPSSAAITEGARPLSDDAVVALQERRVLCPAGHAPGVFCSGVLVAPRVVLTAAHCVVDRRLDDFEVYFGADALGPGIRERAVEVRIHEAYDASTREADIALIALAAPALAPPVELGLATVQAGDVGAGARLVGFGSPSAGIDPGIKLEGRARIESLTATTLTLAAAPSLACRGDSGGPAFLERDGVEHLVGIVRSGDPGCELTTELTRLDAYLEPFLLAAIDELGAAASPGVGDPGTDFCGSTCQENSDCPVGLRCLPERDGSHCGTVTLRGGLYGEECTSADACGAGSTCAAWAWGGDQECRCFTSCRDVPAAGCQSAPSASSTNTVALAVLLALGFMFRKRTHV